MDNIIRKIETALQLPLAGIVAHQKLAPTYRKVKLPSEGTINKAKKAATLLLLYYKNTQLHFVVIERVAYNGVHSAQISFPGGKKEEVDKDFEETALRETFEEIGVNPKNVKTLGKLTNVYIPPSNFYVYPYVGFINKEVEFTAQPTEVESIIEISVSDLMLDNNLRKIKKIVSNGLEFEVPAFVFSNCTIWGATAIMLSEFKMLLKSLE